MNLRGEIIEKGWNSGKKNWIDKNKETRSYLTGRINEELRSLINTIRATILKGKL